MDRGTPATFAERWLFLPLTEGTSLGGDHFCYLAVRPSPAVTLCALLPSRPARMPLFPTLSPQLLCKADLSGYPIAPCALQGRFISFDVLLEPIHSLPRRAPCSRAGLVVAASRPSQSAKSYIHGEGALPTPKVSVSL